MHAVRMREKVEPRSVAEVSTKHPADGTQVLRRAPMGGEPISRRRQVMEHEMVHPGSPASAAAAQTYWSASGRVWALRSLLDKAADDRERDALSRLRAIERHRMETAREVLDELGAFEALPKNLLDHEAVPWPLRHKSA